VDWWTSGAPESRWALDGGPSFGYRPRAVGGGGQCDAILGDHDRTVGVVEVEGTRIAPTIDKIGKFFAAEYPELDSLRFAICLLYAYTPQGRGLTKRFLPVASSEVKERLGQLSAATRPKVGCVIPHATLLGGSAYDEGYGALYSDPTAIVPHIRTRCNTLIHSSSTHSNLTPVP